MGRKCIKSQVIFFRLSLPGTAVVREREIANIKGETKSGKQTSKALEKSPNPCYRLVLGWITDFIFGYRTSFPRLYLDAWLCLDYG